VTDLFLRVGSGYQLELKHCLIVCCQYVALVYVSNAWRLQALKRFNILHIETRVLGVTLTVYSNIHVPG
jgi:hypothetical protein